MGHHSTFLTGAVIMFLTGIGIPVMAAINAGLGKGLGSPVVASATLFAVAMSLAAIAVLVTGAPDWSKFTAVPPSAFTGGAFIVAYVLAVTYFAPRMGVGNAVFFVLIGQIVATAVIDHFGLLGAMRMPIEPKRALGLAIMAAGVWLAKKPV